MNLPRRTKRVLIRLIVPTLTVLIAAAPFTADAAPHNRHIARSPAAPDVTAASAQPGQLTAVKPNYTPRALPRLTGRIAVAPVSPKTSSSGSRFTAVAPQPMALTAANAKVALRVLVIGTDSTDFGLATWQQVLDRSGTPYDVLTAKDTQLTTASLVRSDSVGKYDAILLTNNSLLYQDTTGAYVSGFDATEWNTLWDYERNYQVRQVSLYTSYGTFPEDYCLRAGSEGGIDSTPVNATMTSTGAQLWDYLKPTAQVPISLSYVYRSTIATGCNATPILNLGSDVVGVTSTSTDGRQRAALTFTSNQYLPQATLFGYGLLRWATKGVFVGEDRHYINVDVDDWFNNGDELYPDGTTNTDPGFRLSASDAIAVNTEQNAARAANPLLGQFKLNLAYNGGDAVTSAPNTCTPSATSADPLTSVSKCEKNDFRWINHSLTHPKMNTTDYTTSYNEITQNLQVAKQLGLSVPTSVFKSPEYSGLGVYNPDPNDDIDPPTDYGMGASNAALLQAAHDAGVKYMHGNMSFASQRPSCWNCGIYNPVNPSILVVPDWPTNIAYFSTTPDEETYFYNLYYGPGGKFPYWPANLNYSQIIDQESTLAMQQIMSGTAYTFTFHQDNLRQYAAGKSLVFDWLNAVAAKYSSYYQVPLLNPQWTDLAAYAQDRTAHFAALAGKADAVWDRTTNLVTYTPTTTGALFTTGMKPTLLGGLLGQTTTSTYGKDTVGRTAITAGSTVTLTAVPRSAP
jgi:hypothetical protein